MSDGPGASRAWAIELIVVRSGRYSAGERRELSRDVERGLLQRLRRGVYVLREALVGLTVEEHHVLAARALAAASEDPPLFSHATAAVLLGLPVLRERLGRVHVSVLRASERSVQGVAAHLLSTRDSETVSMRGLRVTGLSRTVVDIAGAMPFEEGVMAADAALSSGVPRVDLLAARDLAGPRRAAARTAAAVAFAHPRAESPHESCSRATMLRLGVEVPELQHRIVLGDGSAVFLDFLFPGARVGGEADGAGKYIDPRMAPDGAGAAVLPEKRREDEIRALLDGLARWGWRQGRNPELLGRVLARAGVHRLSRPPLLADWAAAADGASPRRPHSRMQA